MVTAIKTRPTQAVKCQNDLSDTEDEDVWFDAAEGMEDSVATNSYFHMNTNTNNIRQYNFLRIQIRILFSI